MAILAPRLAPHPLHNSWLEPVLFFAPVMVLGSMVIAFSLLPLWLGTLGGYYLSFALYWLGWCGALPLAVTGLTEWKRFFRLPRKNVWSASTGVLLLWPLVFGYGLVFPRLLPLATAPVLAASAALAVVNATAEELLWRGAFLYAFGDDRLRGYWLPAAGFAAWHFAPQIVFPNAYGGGSLGFVVFALMLGLSWGEVARRTGGALLPLIIVHALFDFSGMGGRLFFG